MTSIALVAAVNDDSVLSQNLVASPLVVSNSVPISIQKNASSASIAYNKGIDETDSDVVVFAHQDVYFPEGWLDGLMSWLERMELIDSDWAVIGLVGLTPERKVVGRVWSTGIGNEVGRRIDEPAGIVTIDEMVIIVRRGSGLRFDQNLPGFHLYATDVILEAEKAGMKSYVIDLPAVHNSVPVRTLRGGYAQVYGYMKRKWRERLPVYTLVSSIDHFSLGLWWSEYRIMRRRYQRRKQPTSLERPNPRTIARELGYET